MPKSEKVRFSPDHLRPSIVAPAARCRVTRVVSVGSRRPSAASCRVESLGGEENEPGIEKGAPESLSSLALSLIRPLPDRGQLVIELVFQETVNSAE